MTKPKKQIKKLDPNYLRLENKLRKEINQKGFVQLDERLKRTTRSLPGHFIVIDKKVIDELKKYQPLTKYLPDYDRISRSGLFTICDEARKDPNSRRLMVFNVESYRSIFQCFVSFHFVYTHRGNFDLYVYQRSLDISKLKDDLIFYVKLSEIFEKMVETIVPKIVVVLGHSHSQL